MTWREQRIVARLGTLLCVLVVAVLIVLAMKYRENRAPAPDSSAAVAVAAEEHSSCTALCYCNGTVTLDFHRNDAGKWVWTADPDFPLDDTQITAILETLSQMEPQQTIETVESLDALGLDSPAVTISAVYEGDGSYTLSFGSATTDGTSFYAMKNSQSSPVYIYSGEILELMQAGVYDMCILPQLPELPEERVQRVTIQGAAGEDGTLPRSTIDAAAQGETLSWKCGEKDVTKAQRVRELFTDLASLKLEQCVTYRPSPEAAALCGFTAPTATLWANYITSTELESHFQMVIGGLTLDGQGRYVRIGDDPSIYRISTDTLDSILVIALSGFEG